MEEVSYGDRDYAFGQVMLSLRSTLELTQAELAGFLGVSRRAVGDWEAGNKYPKADHLKQFIALAVKQGAFPAGREAEAGRALWRAAHQKVLLDEDWLASLLPQPSPPLASQGGAGTTGAALPFQPTPFVGRAAELATIAALLGDPTCRLLTLLGPGGGGKTRLAIAVAEGQTGQFPDGVVFVALASVGSPDQIVSAIGEALGLSFAGQQDPATYLLGYLRDRRLLLVLDNFDRLLAGADLVVAILERAPRVTVLITSRERLNLQAEWLFDVEGLTYPPAPPADTWRGGGAPPNLAEWAGYSAVQLFLQRAAQVQPGFAVTKATLLAVGRICQQVAGLPLAIELAAAGVRNLPIAEIEQQIRANLATLATTLRDVPARHRSLRAVFDHSWDLLAADEHALFSRMAVFRGGWAPEAAAEVAGATRRGLETLVDKSLVRARAGAGRTAPGSGAPVTALDNVAEAHPRFVLLEPIREYALEKLAERGETATLQRAHAGYYLALAEATAALWDSPAADAAIAQLDRERDNMRAALQWSRAGGDLTLGLRLGVALRRFWQRRGYYTEGRVWLEDLLARDAQTLDDTPDSSAIAVRARAAHTAAWLASDQHDYARAMQLFDQSRELRRALGETEDDTQLLVPEARQARASGDYRRATARREDAVARHHALGDRGSVSSGGLGNSLYELALVLREQGQFARAIALFEECLQLHRELGEREGIAVGLMGLGDVARDQADAEQVRRYCEQSLVLCRELGLQWAIGFLLNNLALAAYLDQDLPQATALIGESIALFRTLEADSSLGEVLITQGHILQAQGDAAAAYQALAEALRLVAALGPRLMVAITLEGLAGLVAQWGVIDLAVQILAAAAALRAQMGTPMRPLDHVLQTTELAEARAILGADTYAAMWELGSQLPIDQIGSLVAGVAAVAAPPRAPQELPTPAPPSTPLESQADATVSDRAHPPQELTAEAAGPRLDWSRAPVIPAFYGRAWELALLTEWLVQDRCRVVSVLGLGGIGKSALAIHLTRQVAAQFAVVIWRSLRDLPTGDALLDDLVQALAPQARGQLPASDEQRLSFLLEQLRGARVLLVLDNLESALEEGDETGRLRSSYESFGRLLRQVADTNHPSCVLLTSREKPGDLLAQEGSHSPVRALRLARLDVDACAALLADKGVQGAAPDRARLIDAYAGNPLALNIVAHTIVNLFNGDLALFLEQDAVIFGAVRGLLAAQFNRLSPIEQGILVGLATLREPATLEDLYAKLVPPISRVQVLEGLGALRRRSLIERGPQAGSFTLQAVVREYVTTQLISEASKEIGGAAGSPD